MRLQDKILKARKAIRAAGFASGKFKPSGTALRVDIIVPVTFDDFDLSMVDLAHYVRDKIALAGEIGGTVESPTPDLRPSTTPRPPTIRCPYDLRTAMGKAWKQGRLAGVPV